MAKKDWYDEAIEKPIRKLVRLLRDNGFNTTCSCGHEEWIEMEWYCNGEITKLFHLLLENKYKSFRITTSLEKSAAYLHRHMTVTLNCTPCAYPKDKKGE